MDTSLGHACAVSDFPLSKISAFVVSSALFLTALAGLGATTANAAPGTPGEAGSIALQGRAGNPRLLSGTMRQIAQSLPVVKPIYVGFLGTQSFIPNAVANKKDKRGCNLRQQMISKSASVTPKVGKKCKMTGGVWWLNGGTKKVTKAQQVVLAPAIPYKQAWGQGASQWTPQQRLAWATQVVSAKPKMRAKTVSQIQATQQLYTNDFAKGLDEAFTRAAEESARELEAKQASQFLFKVGNCWIIYDQKEFWARVGLLPSEWCERIAQPNEVKVSRVELTTICDRLASRIANTAAWGLSLSPGELSILQPIGFFCSAEKYVSQLIDMTRDNGITPIPDPEVVPGMMPGSSPQTSGLGTFNSYPASAAGVSGTRQLFGVAAPADWAAPRVPVGYLRLWDAGVTWRQIERTKGQYDWSTMDRTIERAGSIGASVMYVLGDTPGWANGGQAGNVPPSNLQDAADFVGAICRKYQGSIASYEVWNEGNLSTFWTGSMDQLADLTAKVNAAVKGCFPSSKVLASSTGTRADGAFVRNYPAYLQALASRDWPVDGYTVHTYPAADGGPRERVNELGQFKTLLAQNNAPIRAIMDTELNYGLAGLGQERRVIDANTGAAYISQSYIQSLQYGVDSLFWFLWTEGDYDKLGIQLNPSTDTTIKGWNTTYQWLVGSTMTRCTVNVTLHACQIRMADGTNATLMWTDIGEVTAAISGLGTRVQRLDGTVARAPENGSVVVGISPIAVL